MNFKTYDILSSLVPGFLALLVFLNVMGVSYDKDFIIGYTAISFLLGYVINTISSWLEGIYFFTWGGKPSSRLLSGKGIWKVKFYQGSTAKSLLSAEVSNANPSDDELFARALTHMTETKNTRIDDFNALYAFSRALLTTGLFGTIVLLLQYYNDWKFYAFLLPTLFVLWLRCKQRGYYYAREVLNTYIKLKSP